MKRINRRHGHRLSIEAAFHGIKIPAPGETDAPEMSAEQELAADAALKRAQARVLKERAKRG